MDGFGAERYKICLHQTESEKEKIESGRTKTEKKEVMVR